MNSLNRPLIEFLLAHGLDLTLEDGLAQMLTYRRIKPLLGLFLRNRARYPAWEEQAAKALCEFVRKRDLKWVSLMVWAKADPLLKVHPMSEIPYEEADEPWKESAAEIAVQNGDVEIFTMLKIDPTAQQAEQLLRSMWFGVDLRIVKRLLKAGADPNAYDLEAGSILHHLLDSFGRSCEGHFRRRDPRQDVELIAWMIRKGARWVPPAKDWDTGGFRRAFYRGEAEVVVEVIRLLDVGNACDKDLLRDLVDKPKMREWVRPHEPDLFDRLLR